MGRVMRAGVGETSEERARACRAFGSLKTRQEERLRCPSPLHEPMYLANIAAQPSKFCRGKSERFDGT